MTELKTPYKNFIQEFYQEGYFTGGEKYGAYVDYQADKSYIVRNMRKFLATIKTIKSRGKLLDVGCALGFFVELAQMHGYDAYGFDPSDFAVTAAQKLVGKNRIKLGSIGSIQYSKKTFDVITMFDVFEHLEDPAKDIKKLMTYLKDDGIIVIATGDSSSVSAKVLKRRWTFYTPPQHLFFFDRNTMKTLLTRLKLTPITWFRIGKWLSLRYVLHLASTDAESKLAGFLYPLVYRTRLGEIPLYLPMQDNMVVVARKVL